MSLTHQACKIHTHPSCFECSSKFGHILRFLPQRKLCEQLAGYVKRVRLDNIQNTERKPTSTAKYANYGTFNIQNSI